MIRTVIVVSVIVSMFVAQTDATACHCEERSDAAIPCLTRRRWLVRQGIAASLRSSQ
jgi:hypothetical protein